MNKRSEKNNRVAPTCTVTPDRVCVFQPTFFPKMLDGEWVATAHGRCKITRAKLGQRHAAALAAIQYTALARYDLPDGGIELLVDPAAVRRKMSGSGQHSLQGLKDLCEDLRAAVVTIKTPKVNIVGGFLDHVLMANAPRRNPLTGGKRDLWRVRLGIAATMLIRHDNGRLYHDPQPVAALSKGISQAVARHVLTHKSQPRGGWIANNLIAAAAGRPASGKDRAAIKHDAAQLKTLGIGLVIDKKGHLLRITWTKNVPPSPDNVPPSPDNVPPSPDNVPPSPDIRGF